MCDYWNVCRFSCYGCISYKQRNKHKNFVAGSVAMEYENNLNVWNEEILKMIQLII